MVAAQIAKIKRLLRGARYEASTDKAPRLVAGRRPAWTRVINYKTQPLAQALAEANTKGIDVYFEQTSASKRIWTPLCRATSERSRPNPRVPA